MSQHLREAVIDLDAVRVGLAKGWDAAIACERAHLVKLRHTPEARAKLDGFLKK